MTNESINKIPEAQDALRRDWRALETFSFGDDPQLADELADLVLAGKKTATCWAAGDGLSTDVGKRMVVHEVYFSRLGQFTPGMQLWCQRFRVVEIIPLQPD